MGGGCVQVVSYTLFLNRRKRRRCVYQWNVQQFASMERDRMVFDKICVFYNTASRTISPPFSLDSRHCFTATCGNRNGGVFGLRIYGLNDSLPFRWCCCIACFASEEDLFTTIKEMESFPFESRSDRSSNFKYMFALCAGDRLKSARTDYKYIQY